MTTVLPSIRHAFRVWEINNISAKLNIKIYNIKFLFIGEKPWKINIFRSVGCVLVQNRTHLNHRLCWDKENPHTRKIHGSKKAKTSVFAKTRGTPSRVTPTSSNSIAIGRLTYVYKPIPNLSVRASPVYDDVASLPSSSTFILVGQSAITQN